MDLFKKRTSVDYGLDKLLNDIARERAQNARSEEELERVVEPHKLNNVIKSYESVKKNFDRL